MHFSYTMASLISTAVVTKNVKNYYPQLLNPLQMALRFQFIRIRSDLRIFRICMRSTYDTQMEKKYSQMRFMNIYIRMNPHELKPHG